MSRNNDYILDIDGLTAHGRSESTSHEQVVAPSFKGRPWLSVHWRCCGVYSRVYRNSSADAYVGYCPKCAKPVRVKVAPSGSNARFFEAW